MDIQVKACFKKELMAFFRTKRFLAAACVIIGLSILSPLIIFGTSRLMDSMSDVYDELGMDVSVFSAELSDSAQLGVSSQIGDVSQSGLLVYLLLINSFAGGEQKKRSIIIPSCSGLGSFGYIFPKFIIYPTAVFVLSLMGLFAAVVVSGLVFEHNDIVLRTAVLGGALVGVYNMFYVCLHLTLGTSTGKAGLSSAVCIVASFLLPNFFVMADAAPAFNPFTMNVAAVSAAGGGEAVSDIAIGLVVTLFLVAALFFIALFVQNAKKIDNRGSEIII